MLDLAFPFSVGVLSLFSPCALPLLPAYLSYYMGLGENEDERGKAIARGLLGGAVCTLGIATVFLPIGALTSLIGEWLTVFELVAGVLLLVLGVAMLLGFSITVPVKAPSTKGAVGLYLFGILYGLAIAGCCAPMFISVMVWGLRGGPVQSFAVFLSYTLGVGLPMIAISGSAAGAKRALRLLSGFSAYVGKIGGAILIGVGAYMLYSYWLVM